MLLKSNHGFVFIEVLITFSIVLMTVNIIFPTIMIIKSERQALKDRLLVATKLNDLIHLHIYDEQEAIPNSFSQPINDLQVTFHMSIEQSLLKGCAIWENVKDQKESFCLYAYRVQ